MKIDHIHFYVESSPRWCDWFIRVLGFQPTAHWQDADTQIQVLQSGILTLVLSAPLTDRSPVATYLQQHPAGVADLAFAVSDLNAFLIQAIDRGAKLIHADSLWAQLEGWGPLKHTIVQRNSSAEKWLPIGNHLLQWTPAVGLAASFFTEFDHVVLNVARGELDAALTWYEDIFGFQRQQTFTIQTDRSALHSQVLIHPDGIQFPINEPGSSDSQIQEFLDLNRGAGIQHIALRTPEIVQTIATLRQRGLAFLPVPLTYYEQLKQRPGFDLTPSQWQSVRQQEVLVDWREATPEALLLQAFTTPIFETPTFFFELIERQTYWSGTHHLPTSGFGEGNFRALFEAIEREQLKRGSLR